MQHRLRCLATLVLTTAAIAQGRITDSNVTYVTSALPALPTATTIATTDMQASPAISDSLLEVWWYYRLAGDAREWAFNTAGGQLSDNWIGNRATLAWANVDNRGFSARLEITAYSTGAARGVVAHRMTLTNTSNTPITLDVFALVDVDHCNSSGGDSATANPTPNRQRITDNCIDPFEVFASSPDHWQVAPYPNLHVAMTSAGLNNLNDTGLPFGPGFYSAAFQWQNRRLAPMQSLTVRMSLALAHTVCDGAASSTEYGIPKAGTNGIPSWGNLRPYLGGTTNLQITNGLAGAGPIAFMSLASASVPLPGIGGHLNIDGGTLIGLPLASFSGGRASDNPLSIPNDAALCNAKVFFQAFFFDTGAAVAPIAHTAGLEWLLGSL